MPLFTYIVASLTILVTLSLSSALALEIIDDTDPGISYSTGWSKESEPVGTLFRNVLEMSQVHQQTFHWSVLRS